VLIDIYKLEEGFEMQPKRRTKFLISIATLGVVMGMSLPIYAQESEEIPTTIPIEQTDVVGISECLDEGVSVTGDSTTQLGTIAELLMDCHLDFSVTSLAPAEVNSICDDTEDRLWCKSQLEHEPGFVGILKRSDEEVTEALAPAKTSVVPVPVVTPKAFYNAGVEPWRRLVASYFVDSDVDLALSVMWCESKGDPNAANPRSSARGLFQNMEKYWFERSAAAGWAGASIFDPEANTAVAAWLVYQGGGWSHWNASRGCWG
jgi:hypothetical protein